MTKILVNNRRMASKLRRPTEAELSILHVLWETGPSTVREILHKLNEQRPTGYTTVLKMLQIMTEKGHVERDESRKPQVYRAAHSRQQTQHQLVRDLLQRAFDGSVKALVLQALSTRKASQKDLEAMERLLDQMEGDRR